MVRSSSSLLIWLCVAIVLYALSSARADEALPSQEQALTRALENHPDIVAAKARVALADAELYGKRIDVSRQVLGLYGSLKKLESQVVVAKAALNKSQQSAAKGGTLAYQVQIAEAELVDVINQREQMEKEFRLLIGNASPPAGTISPNGNIALSLQTPQGEIVKKMNAAKESVIKLDFVDTPLAVVIEFLSDRTGVEFSLHLPALEGMGFSAADPISLQTSDVPLHAALQAFEDAYPDMQFTLRDYGVLLTTKEYAQTHGFVPVLEPSKESAATIKAR